MSEVQKNKDRLVAVEEEHKKLPLYLTQIMGVLKLTDEEVVNLDTARWRVCFRMILLKNILEALISRSVFGNVEEAAKDLGEPILEELKTSVDRLVGELLVYGEKEGRKELP